MVNHADSSSAPRPAVSGESTISLLERMKAGDATAVDALFARYVAPLTRWAQGRLPRYARSAADTQDLVQETLLQTFKRIGTFESQHEGALQAYLRQAVMNRVRDELRRYSRRGAAAAVDSQIEHDDPSPLDQAIGQQAAERYEQALARLRPDDRELLIARIEMGFSFEQLAEAFGKPTAGAARKATQRALLRLAEEMRHVK